MSYTIAKQCFAEARDMVGKPMNDPNTFNLHQGLLNLTDQIQSDMTAIKHQLRTIEQILKQLR